jgi:hypothetical protein
MPSRPLTPIEEARTLMFTSVDDCCRRLGSFPYSLETLEIAYNLAVAYGQLTRMKLLQSAIRKYNRELRQELQP